MWACAAVAVSMLGIVAVSAFYSFGWIREDSRVSFGIRKGAFRLYIDTAPPGFAYTGLPPPGWWAKSLNFERLPKWSVTPLKEWLFAPSMSRLPGSREVLVPLAGVALVPGLIATGLWLNNRRKGRKGACSSCNYDRAGVAPAAPCPECGATPTK